MDLPLISIIIPVYNAEKTIERAIKSIQNQNFSDFELLLINDGSHDNSRQIIELFANEDSRIKLYNEKNSGVSSARNKGITHANGKYILFLDADDYYVENAFETIIPELDEGTQLVIFGYIIQYGKEYSKSVLPDYKNLEFNNKKNFRDFAVSLISNEMINAPWNKIYLTRYIKENKIIFPPDLNIGEDLKFNLSVIRDIQNVKISNKPLVNYTVKKGEGLVSKFRKNRFELRYSLLMELKELLTYWDKIFENQAMIDRMVIRDIMAYFMDFYKSSCSLTYNEKLNKINNIILRKDIRDVLNKNHYDDISTRVLELILRTNNAKLILLAAKILSIKRVIK